LLCLTLIVFFTAVPVAFSQSESAEEDGVLVGRVSFVEGELLRYVPAEEDWVATVQDAPFGLDDALYSDEKGRAEFAMPNGTWLRIDGGTQVQMIVLKDDVTEVDVASGVARLYNRGADTIVKATTPFGYVVAPAGTIFDMYVGDESVEVIALKGQVDFILESDESRYEVASGSSSIIADSREVTSGEGTVDADWDDWNLDRDDIRSKRLQVKGDSVKYLPEQLQDDAYELEENGQWERVEYEGEQRTLWRPTRVEAGWQPFTAGRWTVYHEDNCWVPDEPFGYVTHHYGNWVYAGSSWYWAPPVVRVRVGAPVVGIGFGWYPGRVAWIHSDVHVGWVPLAPSEVYYSHRHWGRRSVVIGSAGFAGVHINLGGFRYVNRAVIVNSSNFYGVRNYRNVRITNINRTVIINKYRGAPVVNRTVIKNYNNIRQRYNYTNVTVNRKPHHSVVERINRNQKISREVRTINSKSIRQNVERTKQGRFNPERRLKRSEVTNKLVSPDDVKKPRDQVKFQERELKGKARNQEERKSRREGRPEMKEPKRPERREGKPEAAGEDRRKGRPDRPEREVRPEGREDRRAPGEERDRVKRERPERPERKVRPEGREDKRAPGEERDRVKRERPERPEREVRPKGREEKRAPVDERERMKRERQERQQQETSPGAGGAKRTPAEERGRMRQDRPERAGQEVRPERRGEKRAPAEERGRVGHERPEREMQPGRPVEQRQDSRRQMREERQPKQEQMTRPGAGGQQGPGRQMREQRESQRPQERVNQGGQREQRRQQQDGERKKKKKGEDEKLEEGKRRL
jgi:hypothetical protein